MTGSPSGLRASLTFRYLQRILYLEPSRPLPDRGLSAAMSWPPLPINRPQAKGHAENGYMCDLSASRGTEHLATADSSSDLQPVQFGRVIGSPCARRVIMHWPLLLFLFPSSLAHAADMCNPADLVGPYAFQLTGLTDIAGPPRPTVSLGRVVFDGQGGLSGTASAMFRGLLLGNLVTGSYEARSDCSVIWRLQDDSGGFQNFSGTFSVDGAAIRFKQTDPAGAQHGIMKRTSDACSAADLLSEYTYTVSGSTTPMQPGEVPHTLSAKGTLGIAENGSFQVDRDCSVRFGWTLRAQDGEVAAPSTMSMRGFLVDGGKEILAFQTDPGATVAARFNSEKETPQ